MKMRIGTLAGIVMSLTAFTASAHILEPANYVSGTVVAIDARARTVTVGNRIFSVVGFLPKQGDRVLVAHVGNRAWISAIDP